jgi:hypothetical protein
MRDKVPSRHSTGTGQGDVVRKGDSAERRESLVLAIGRLDQPYSHWSAGDTVPLRALVGRHIVVRLAEREQQRKGAL